MKTILVTGGLGFIGSNIIKRLISMDDINIISIDNLSTGSNSNIIESKRIDYKYTDIRSDLEYIFDQNEIDCVFHMAAKARIQPSFNDPVDYFDVNVNGTINILELCVRYNVPIIHAGTSSIHSGKFKNPYTFSKEVSEDTITLYSKLYGLKYSITRFYNVYGDNQLLDGDYSTLIGRWLGYLQRNEMDKIVIYGTGHKRRDFTHVDDIVDALIRIYINKSYGYTFELGRGVNYSINDVANMFGITPKFMPDKSGEALVTLNTNNIAKEILNWNPSINLEDYIKQELNKL